MLTSAPIGGVDRAPPQRRSNLARLLRLILPPGAPPLSPASAGTQLLQRPPRWRPGAPPAPFPIKTLRLGEARQALQPPTECPGPFEPRAPPLPFLLDADQAIESPRA